MLPTRDKFISYMRNSNGRRFAVKLVVNGADFACEIRKLKIKKGSSDVQPGCYYSSSVDAEIRSSETIKNGDKLEVWISAPLSGDTEFYKVVTAYVRKPLAKSKEVSFTAEGTIAAKLGWEFAGQVDADIQALINNISIVTGATIILEDDMDSSLIPNTAANLDGYLLRDLLADISGLFFGYATEDVDGNILIKKFSNNAENVIELKTDRTAALPAVYDTVTVQGIQITTTTEEGQADYVYPADVELVNYSLYNPLMTEEIFNTYVDNFVGFTYTPYTAEFTLGDISLEPWDNIIINGQQTIITEITHTFDGGIKTEILAATLADGETYSRTDREMKADISYAKYPTAVSSGGSSGGDDVVVDPEGHYELSSKSNADSTNGAFNVYIKDGYMGVIECISGGYNSYEYGILHSPAQSNIEAKFMPAYPVRICVRGYTRNSGGTSSYATAAQIDILPELDENGYVKVVYSSALLDPKRWYKAGNMYWYKDASLNKLQQFSNYAYRVQYLLKSYVDSLENEKEEATE